MSSRPGYTLEDFVGWNFDLELGDPRLPAVVAPFEPYRESVERALSDFDDETQSWRDYACGSFDFIPDDVYKAGAAAKEQLSNSGDSPKSLTGHIQ